MRRPIKLSFLDKPARDFLTALKDLRLDAGLSQRDLGRQIGLRAGDIKHYEHGRYAPSIEILLKLADFLGYDLTASINYKFFHRSISPYALKAKIKRYGLNYSELAELTGYGKQIIFETVNYRRNASLGCMAAILDILEQEKNAYAFRNNLLKKGGGNSG